MNDLVAAVDQATDAEITVLVSEYEELYDVAPELRRGGERHHSLRNGAAIELGLLAFLEDGDFCAFTDTFEDLGAPKQLPGLAVQRLMAEGYGFGAEGDWKTAVLVRAASAMGAGRAHMIEVSPALTTSRPSLEIHPLGIGGKDDPVRLVFTADPGPATVVALTDLRDRFRLTANVVDVVAPRAPLPHLPVGRAVWHPRPDFATSATAWLMAGAAHRTVMSTAIGLKAFGDLARTAGIDLLAIDEHTRLRDFENELRWNQAYWRLAPG